MDTSIAMTPQRVVSYNQTFSIPVYQRLFTWTPRDIKSLLSDLKEQFVKSRSSHYHIGLLTSTHNHELVDGQQRFVVMTLMAIVLKQYYKEWEMFPTINGALRLKFAARKEDEEYILSMCDGGQSRHENKLMKAGKEAVDEWIKENVEIDAKEFSEYIYKHLAFFIQELPEGYSGRMLNKYFESMNSTGRNLEAHEILKVELLEKVDENEYNRLVQIWNKVGRMSQPILPSYDEEKRKEYEKTINLIKEGIFTPDNVGEEESEVELPPTISELLKEGTISERKGSSVRRSMRHFLTFTDFLLQVLYIHVKNKEQINNLHEFFKPDNLRATFGSFLKEDDIKDFIEDLYRYRIILDWAIITFDEQGDYRLAMTSGDMSCLQQYEAMLYTSTSRDTYYQWVPCVLTSVMELGSDENELLERLKKEDNDNKTHGLPDRTNMTFKGFSNYYFRRLDYYIWEAVFNKNDERIKLLGIESDEVFKGCVSAYRFRQYDSVEHFYPQNNENQTAEWEVDSVNCFGNLALISDSFNSSLKHRALEQKMDLIKNHVRNKSVQSLKLLIMYYLAKGNQDGWTPDLAHEHGEKMYELLNGTFLEQNV